MEATSKTPNPIPAKPAMGAEGMASSQRKARASDGEADSNGADFLQSFSRLLQAAGLPQTGTVDLAQGAGLPQTDGVELAGLTTAMPEQISVLSAPGLEWAPAPQKDVAETQPLGVVADDVAWAMQSLVGQTLILDRSADTAVRDGTHVQSRLDAGDPLQMMRSVTAAASESAAQVPVVAQGTTTLHALAGGSPPVFVATDSSVAAWNAVGDAAQSAVDTVSDSLQGDEDGGARSSEGRVALQGQWSVADRQPPPAEAMQRLLGQMTQFLSATGATDAAGLRRAESKNGNELESAGQSATTAALGIGTGAGRLLDSAVAQASASQQASGNDPQGAQAEPAMEFWMNARQQRAEVVLDRDGEPVRVQIAMEGSTAHVTFRSDAQATRSMLDASVNQLRELLEAQGLELAGVQVEAQASGGQSENGSAARDAFMPQGARRVRLPEAAASDLLPGTVRASSVSGQGVDIFA